MATAFIIIRKTSNTMMAPDARSTKAVLRVGSSYILGWQGGRWVKGAAVFPGYSFTKATIPINNSGAVSPEF